MNPVPVKILMVRLHSSLANAIMTQGVRVVAFGFVDQANTKSTDDESDHLKVIPWDFHAGNRLLAGVRQIFRLVGLIRAEKPSVVHVNALQDLFYVFLAVRFCSFFQERPIIVTMSRDPRTWQNPAKSRLASWFLDQFSDGFVSLSSRHQWQLLGLGFPTCKLAVISNPYDVGHVPAPRIEMAVHSGPRMLRIIYVAHISERKAQDVLIRTAALVLAKYPDVQFEMVGKVLPGEEAYAARVVGIIEELGLSSRVTYSGPVPHAELPGRLSDSDIFVFPSRSEMMPRAVIEAMVAGLPVVATAVDGILDLIEDGRTGILVQPDDADGLAEGLCSLIADPGMARQMGAAGQAYILNYCSPRLVGESLCAFYRLLLDRQGFFSKCVEPIS